nr:uncharacterized protein LOC127345992 [Lolium perenne]
MERSSSSSKALFLLQFLLLSQILEARILGDAHDYKRLVASSDGAVLSWPHLNPNLNLKLNMVNDDDNDALDRPSKYTPPAPKPDPSPHPVAPPRNYSRQQPEAAGHPPSRPAGENDGYAYLQTI